MSIHLLSIFNGSSPSFSLFSKDLSQEEERDWQIVSDTEREYMSRLINEEMALRSICNIRGQEL